MTLKKQVVKKHKKSTKNPNLVSQPCPWGGGREVSFRHFFDTFSSPGVPGTPLGKKWPQDLSQEPPGPLGHQCLMIFTQFSMPVLASFCRFGAHAVKKTIGKKTHENDNKSEFGLPTGSLAHNFCMIVDECLK